MTKVTAAQLGPDRIRVNCICPGLIATNIFAQGLRHSKSARRDAYRCDCRVGQELTADPARWPSARHREAALYLASDGASFVTGQALTVDGGITLGPSGAQQMSVFAPIVQALGIDGETMAQIMAARAQPG